MPVQNNLELLSNEVNEIVRYRPHWIIRRGNSIFAAVLCVLLALTFVIRYPDVIAAPARLLAANPPKLINAKKEGRLLKLCVANEEPVKKGQLLGYIESGADYPEVTLLQRWIESTIGAIHNSQYQALLDHPLPLLTNLGGLQSSYQDFQNQFEYTRQTLANGYFNKKYAALEHDLQNLATLRNNALQQQQLVEADRQLQKKEYDAYEKLAKDKVIAPLELNQYKSRMIGKEQTLKQAYAQLTNAEISSQNKMREMLELKKQVADQQQHFISALLTLKSNVEAWMEQYVLVAGEEGRVLFSAALQENQLISAGQNLFYILPDHSGFYVEITASQKGFGKIDTGQKVLLSVESFPNEEFGRLTGNIQHISPIPNSNDSFLIRVSLPRGLETNYGRTLFFKPGLKAQAEIITSNRRLAGRLLGQLKKIWDQ
ncbi:MAG: HlyD family efflux transporter periplasmic adaptor subunit [Ferruginibacter sp.]|nr:HlyD family efflux transporter periplasmic adaptor subunit [Ferruginibacter sp.]